MGDETIGKTPGPGTTSVSGVNESLQPEAAPVQPTSTQEEIAPAPSPETVKKMETAIKLELGLEAQVQRLSIESQFSGETPVATGQIQSALDSVSVQTQLKEEVSSQSLVQTLDTLVSGIATIKKDIFQIFFRTFRTFSSAVGSFGRMSLKLKNLEAKYEKGKTDLNDARKALEEKKERLFQAKKMGDTSEISLGEAAVKNAETGVNKLEGKLTILEAKIGQAQESLTGKAMELEKAKQEKWDATEKLRDFLKTARPDQAAEIDRIDFDKVTGPRKFYETQVDGMKVQSHEKVESHATTGKAKLTVDSVEGDSRTLVNETIDKMDLSDSTKKILKGVSSNESTFGGVNASDRKGLAWGMLQWEGGEPGSPLSDVLKNIKQNHSAAFAERFQQFGIDVSSKGMLQLHKQDGNVLEGARAARAIETDPKLTAVLARAGMDPEIQIGQIDAGVKKLDRLLNYYLEVLNLDGSKMQVQVSDLITSEYGAGVLLDRGIRAGETGTLRRITRELQVIVNEGKREFPDSAVEKRMIEAILDAKRAQPIEAEGAGKDPGSLRR